MVEQPAPGVGELAYESGSGYGRRVVVVARTEKRALVVLRMKTRKEYQVRWLPVTGYGRIMLAPLQSRSEALALAVAGFRSRLSLAITAPWRVPSVAEAVTKLKAMRKESGR